MIACLREAIHIRHTQARTWPHTSTFSTAQIASLARTRWRPTGGRATLTYLVPKSAIAPLVETWLHLRRELDNLGATFATVKLPGHGGVYPMAAADACAKACHAMRPKDVQLCVHSTLVIPYALPYNPATLATGADPQKWHRWDGRPSPHVPSSRHLRFARSRLQEIGCVRMLDRYRAQHGGEALFTSPLIGSRRVYSHGAALRKQGFSVSYVS